MGHVDLESKHKQGSITTHQPMNKPQIRPVMTTGGYAIRTTVRPTHSKNRAFLSYPIESPSEAPQLLFGGYSPAGLRKSLPSGPPTYAVSLTSRSARMKVAPERIAMTPHIHLQPRYCVM